VCSNTPHRPAREQAARPHHQDRDEDRQRAEQAGAAVALATGALSLLAVLICALAAVNIGQTLFAALRERAREIGVMRAIGASDGSVLRIFVVEGICIGMLSWPVGAVLAFPVSQVLSHVVGKEFAGAPLQYTFSVEGALLWLVLVSILAALASSIPAWSAARLSVREVLTYE